MDAAQALAFVRRQGVALESAAGPVPNVVEAIAGEPMRGSWWSHPRGRAIFRLLRSLRESPEILVCRVVAGKVTFVHRRLWPALARAAAAFPPAHLARLHEEHTAAGRHRVREIPYPEWVPADVHPQARALSEAEALAALGEWAPAPGKRGPT